MITDWDAVEYARHSSLQEAMAEENVALLDLRGTEKVLDVGCGDGKITAALAARLPNGLAVGVDASRKMVAFAARHFSPSSVANLRFAVGDARSLPYRQAFDLIVSFNALHWMSEQTLALRSIHSALKRDGKAILRLVSKGPRKSLEEVIEETCQSPPWARYFPAHAPPYWHVTPEHYRTLAESCGFEVRRLEVEDQAWDFKTREAFIAFCRAPLDAWTHELPEDQRDSFINGVLDRYRLVAATNNHEANTFKFYQMAMTLSASDESPRCPAECEENR